MQEEKIVETKTCKHCNSKFEFTDKDLEFYDKVSPVFSGKKYNISTPNLCPDCRQQRRLSFRNERKLYKRKCDLSGKEIISIYSPDKPYKVYDQKEWWSDKWDAMDYGKDFDFNRGFFEQFDELIREVPTMGLFNSDNEGCEYNNYIKGCKNCYLSSVIYFGCEDVYYSNYIFHSKDIFDCVYLSDGNLCYEIYDSKGCFSSFYLNNCSNCTNCYFSRHLNGCTDCIFCTNLINKKYHIYNKLVSKEEYFKFKDSLFSGSYINLKNHINEYKIFSEDQIFPYLNIINCENSTGNNIFDAKDCQNCFDTYEIEGCKWVCSEKTKDSYDGIGGSNEKCYEYCRVGWCQNVFFTYDGVESSNLLYCYSLYSSKDCFGCVGLRNKQYCIFNKQYTKEEYEQLVPKIIEHMNSPQPSPLKGEGVIPEWGEFFSGSISPFGYNETVAQEYFPLSKEEVIEKGFNWSNYEPPFPKVEKIIPANKLPDSIADIPDDILNWAIECEVTKKPFRIISQELEFYRKHNLPIPRRHPDQRHLDRMSLRNPRKLFDRKCDKCGKEIKTTYNPERKEIVYCEECYNREIY